MLIYRAETQKPTHTTYPKQNRGLKCTLKPRDAKNQIPDTAKVKRKSKSTSHVVLSLRRKLRLKLLCPLPSVYTLCSMVVTTKHRRPEAPNIDSRAHLRTLARPHPCITSGRSQQISSTINIKSTCTTSLEPYRAHRREFDAQT